MAPDTGPLGSQVGQRNIPEEPMVCVFEPPAVSRY